MIFGHSAVSLSYCLQLQRQKAKTSLQSQNNLLFAVPESDGPDSTTRATKVRLNIIHVPWFLVSSVVFHIINLCTALFFLPQFVQKP